VDTKEIGVLRQIKSINDRDNDQLKAQNDQLIREKADLIEENEKKLREIQVIYKEKNDQMQENFRLIEETQNMRFMIQDKDSLIKRLEFKLARGTKDEAIDV